MVEDPYNLLSRAIASDGLRSATIFRRFDRLAVRNLLYLEEELIKLEGELDDLDKEHPTRDMINFVQDWNLLYAQATSANNATPGIDPHDYDLIKHRKSLVEAIRHKLKECRE